MPVTNESSYLPFESSPLPKGSWLVLAPHPDDETFGMGGTLLLAKSQGITVDIIFVTDGGKGGENQENLVKTRELEAQKVAHKLGIRNLFFWREIDRALMPTQHLISKLSDFIKQTQPETVFFPAPSEPHPDHRTTAVIAWESLRLSNFSATPISYDISVQGHTNCLIDISQVVTAKRELMAEYKSQLSENLYIDRLLALNKARTWSLPHSVSHAESFYQWPKENRPLNALVLSLAAQESSLQALPESLPLISVITRTQNRPEFLREAIRSVAGQTYQNIELIVVNDGGANCTELISEEATGHIQQYRYHHIDVQAGRSKAANIGLDLCTGDFIIFLDDDDWFAAEHLSKLMTALLQHPEIKVVYTGVQCVDANKKVLPIYFKNTFDATRLLSGNYIPIHAALFSRTLLEIGCRVDASLNVYEDWDFWIQASMLTHFLFIDGVSAFYRSTGQSDVGLNSTDIAQKEQASLVILKKWLPKLSDKQLIALSGKLQQSYQKETELQNQTIALQNKELALQSKNTKIQNQILDQENNIAELQQNIANKEYEIQESTQLVEHILNSTTWRMTLPLRTILHQRKRALHAIKLIKPAISLGGGWQPTAKKVINLYRRAGFAGIKAGFRRVAESSEHVNTISAITPEIFKHNPPYLAHNILETRVLMIAELSIPQCKKYRVTQKQKMFSDLGIECTVRNWHDYDDCLNELATHSLVIFYRVPAFPNVLKIIDEAKRLQITTLWEVDDLIFDKQILAGSKTLAQLDKATFDGLLEGSILYHKAMLACDKGIASTAELAVAMRQEGLSDVFIIENALDEQTLACANKINATTQKQKDNLIRIVYGSGTNTHDVDFAEVSAALLQILNTFPEVRLRIIGTLELPAAYNALAAQVERIPFCSYEEYLGYLAECDINLAPLENYIFNEAKSNIKFIEASVVKIPSLCSPRSAFTSAIQQGENGFLCAQESDWLHALTLLVTNGHLRTKIGSAAYTSILEHYAPEHIAQQQLQPILAKFKTTTTPKPKILAVNIYYAPQSFGGATIVAEETNRIFNARGDFEVSVFTTLPVDMVAAYRLRRYAVEGINIFALGLPKMLSPTEQFENPHVVAEFAKVLAVTQPDIVHIHSIQGIGVAIIELCISKNIKYVITLHDAWWICGRQFMINQQGSYCDQQKIELAICDSCTDDARLNRLRQAKLKNILTQAELLLSPSQFFADLYLKNEVDPQKIVVNKNGVLKPTNHLQRIRTQETLSFCYVGGNTDIKGVNIIKQTFAQLSDPKVKLVVVDNATNLGFSSYPTDFFTDINHVDIVPAYTQKTIDEFFASIDVLLFPTQWKESFGLTIREALARNVWVITTDAGGVVEDISPGVNGLIVPFNDTGEAFTQAVQETMEFYQQFKVGSEISLQTKRITWFEDQANALTDLYKQVIAQA